MGEQATAVVAGMRQTLYQAKAMLQDTWDDNLNSRDVNSKKPRSARDKRDLPFERLPPGKREEITQRTYLGEKKTQKKKKQEQTQKKQEKTTLNKRRIGAVEDLDMNPILE